ncbi:MAG: hypothetical protein F9K38_05350 [Pseudorhodoplanes sp.]|nr:MAG: hypothetical protein F9K38_05350 [Pseudorhodoplanes sp.]
MGALVALCPDTGRPFETGIETDPASMALTPPCTADIACPHCRSVHRIAKRDFLVCEMIDGLRVYQRAA